MKKVFVGVLCTLGAVACAERRPAQDPSTLSTTSAQSTPAVAHDGAYGETSLAHDATSATVPDVPPSANPNAGSSECVEWMGAAPPSPVIEMTADGDRRADGDVRSADATNVDGRDRQEAVTATDQGGGRDREITASIRRAVVGDKALSFTAKNVTIVTVGGKVTLRGSVKSEAEKSAIETKARSVAGVSGVENQLAVNK